MNLYPSSVPVRLKTVFRVGFILFLLSFAQAVQAQDCPSLTITASPSLTIASGTTGTPCKLMASGATTYKWSTGASTSAISTTVAGTYSVTGTTAGCSTTASVQVVAVTPCSTGKLPIAPDTYGLTGAAYPNYLFLNEHGVISTTFAVGEAIYSFGSDPSGTCKATTSIKPVYATLPAVAQVICPNALTTQHIDYSGNCHSGIQGTCGKVGPIQNVAGTLQTFSIATPGVYPLTFTDGTTVNVTITDDPTFVNTPPTLSSTYSVSMSISPVNPTAGTSLTFTATTNFPVGVPFNQAISPGVSPDDYSKAYLWYINGVLATPNSPDQNPVVLPVQSGDLVTVSVPPYCTTHTPAPSINSIVVCLPGSVSITATPSLTIASGQSVTLTASGATSYVWNDGSTNASLTASPGTTTTYSVTGNSSNGCSVTATAQVTVASSPLAVTATASQYTVCANVPFLVSVTATGGQPPYDYMWNQPDAATTTGDGNTATAVIGTSGLGEQTFQIIVTDANNTVVSSNVVSVTVVAPPSVSITASPSLTLAAGQSVTLTASGADTFLWSTGETSNTLVVDNLTDDTPISVTGTTSAGCSATAATTLSVLTCNLGINGPRFSRVTLGSSATLTANTASPADSYRWSTGETTVSIVISPTATTTYTLTAVTGPCTVTATLTITVQIPALTLAPLASASTVCTQTPFTVSVAAQSGQPPYSYNWTIPDGVTATGLSTSAITVTATSPGQLDFQVTVSSVNGAPSSSTTISVTVVAPPTVTISANPSLTVATGQSVTLTASGADAFLWNTGQTTASLSATTAGAYSVTGTTTAGCSATATANVTQTTLLGPDLTANLTLPDGTFPNTPGAAKDLTMSLFEVGGLPTSAGNITITLTAPLGYTLVFDQSLTSINVSGGNTTAVDNTNWQVSNNQNGQQLSLTIKAGQLIPANGKSVVGFSVVRTSANAGSVANLTVNINDDTGKTYDRNTGNNIYVRILNGL